MDEVLYQKSVVPADGLNNESSPAYLHNSEHALLKCAYTGTFNSTVYSDSEVQLAKIKELAEEVDDFRLAQIAVAGRKNGYMKDVPAYILAILFQRNKSLFSSVFFRVIDTPKMLKIYTSLVRSGKIGTKYNLSSGVHRKKYQEFFDRQSPESIFNGNIGGDPGLTDIIRLAHVRPNTRAKEAVFLYLMNKAYGWSHTQGTEFHATYDDLPDLIKDFELFKSSMGYGGYPIPDVDYRLYEGISWLMVKEWMEIFVNMPVYSLVKNLALANRKGVFEHPEAVELIAEKLRDRDAILKSRLFPHQVNQAYLKNRGSLNPIIVDALQDTLDITLEKVPSIGKALIACDISYSMIESYTGDRRTRQGDSVSSKVRTVDVAALIASALLRTNRNSVVVAFNGNCHEVSLSPRDSVVSNAEKLAALCKGGTNCSSPLFWARGKKIDFDTFVIISDNESWLDAENSWNLGNGTRLHAAWQDTKLRLPAAKMINIDLTPNVTTQVKERPDVLQVSGFSDSVFKVMGDFCRQSNSLDFWTQEIDKIKI